MPTVLEIPIVPGGGPFDQTILLEEEEYIFEFRWNQRDSAHYLSIFKNGELIALALKLVPGLNLLDVVLSLEKPSGFLYLYDTSLNSPLGEDIRDINDLGDKILLVYEPLEEAA